MVAEPIGDEGQWLRTASGGFEWQSIDAADVAIADSGGHFTSTDVEGALQELAASGGGGALTRLYDSGALGADAASIDTGAGGVPGGYTSILVDLRLRSTKAASNDNAILTFNGDTGTNYGYSVANGFTSLSTFASTTFVAPAAVFTCPAASGPANAFGGIAGAIVGYADAFHKVMSFTGGYAFSTTNFQNTWGMYYYVTTSPLSQIKVAFAAANVKAGSRMTIWGRA